MSSLRNKSFQGIVWSLIDKIAGGGISFLIGIILARILSPSAFGLIGIITVFVAFANIMIDSGFSNSLIRKSDCTQVEYDTIFFYNIGVSSFSYFLLYIIAPSIALFFKEDILVILIRILGLIIIINSLTLVQKAIFVKEINFKTQTKVSLISSLLGGILGVAMAYGGYGVWSLVAQIISKQLINGVLMWTYAKWRPKTNFSIRALKSLNEFGSKLLFAGLLSTFQRNIYYFVIGKVFSASDLGFYTRAEQFNAVFTMNITSSLERVFFPVLSSIQESEVQLKSTFRKIMLTSYFVTYFPIILMAILAEPIIYLLIGEKWDQSVIYLQLLCFGSIFMPFESVNINILMVKGRSDLILKLQVLKFIFAVISITIGIFKGIVFMLCINIAVNALIAFIYSFLGSKLIHYHLKEQMRDLFSYFLWETSILLVIMGLGFLPFNLNYNFLLQITTSILLFFFIFEYKRFPEYVEIKEQVIKHMHDLKIKR